jgi:hypothetical protein
MTVPNARDRLPTPEALLAFILRYIQVPSRREEFRVESARQDQFLLLFGLTHRVRRLAQAYLRLRKGDFEVEGQILVRSALEHAVTAQWAYLTVGGIDRLKSSGTSNQYTFVRLLAEYSTDPAAPAQVQEFRDQVLAGPGLPKFTEMIKHLDNNGFLRTTYKVLSQVIHVTHQATLDALGTDDDGEVTLKLRPDADVGHETLYALASSCMLAAWIVADLEGSTDEFGRLQDYSWQLSIPYRLDASLPADARRFEDSVAYDSM